MHRATMRSYTIAGKTYHPAMVSVGDSFSGVASWYGKDFHGKKTSNGEIYNMYDMTAAHKTLPMNTMVKVTHLENGKNLVVRINDRGPFVKSRIIDLSHTAAARIDMIQKGTAPVRVEVVGFGGIVGDRPGYHSVEGGEFMVQIGAFRRNEGARSYADEHKSLHGSYSTKVEEGIWTDAPLYRVYLTGFRSEDEARDFISGGVFEGAFIIRGSQ
ncbi:MAG: septal ring lytic transglycosylase RlpA family protein [Campylobacteraceae bacterium]|nr:septal ring lytic transglycosylase RlpA family protein [Campylobacteraceae bacterium]